jgi:hypothetical protein
MAGIQSRPILVPYGADQTIYKVVENVGTRGACGETESERTELEAVISDLLDGRFNFPARVVAYNTLEHWAEDISALVAVEIQTRCDIDGIPVPEEVEDFVACHAGAARKRVSSPLPGAAGYQSGVPDTKRV